jgi:hypothetical protein
MEEKEVNDYISSIRSTLNDVGCTIDTLPHNASERDIDDRIYQVRESIDDITFQHQHDQLDELLERLYKLK